MKSTIYLRVVLLWAALAGGVHAAGPWPLFDGQCWHFPKLHEMWRQRDCWCPNDYCRKPLPECPPAPNGCCDDFCAKPLPPVPVNPCGACDDYCPKTCPLHLWPLGECWYRCGPLSH
ncbi:MAG: hypothetical protein JNM56_27420 [Planctomycetia bacterium]|nr:hypothetical protein [Planctomycetia bacterium]